MDLTQEDRQRIEQEAIVYTEGHGSTNKNWRGFIDGYTAATIFERQQQAELRNKVNQRIEYLTEGIPDERFLGTELEFLKSL